MEHHYRIKEKPVYESVKRGFDIICSLLGIIGTSPIWIFAILGIEISDPGPVFYMAHRVGKDNKEFLMYKFRSMRVDKNADEKSLRADTNRIFRFGELIRRLKIDELPQLINILKGDMAVVGPRPAAVDQIPITRGGENAIVALLKPGLASPAALYDYLYGDDIEDEEEYMDKVAPTRLALDRYYVGEQAIGYDIKMIWQTVRCIWGTITHHTPVDILEELIDAVNGDRRALEEVKR
ncbi:sugar transferase [Roseburia hominis]